MTRKITTYVLPILLALILGACGPSPTTAPQPISSTEAPVVEPTTTAAPSAIPEATEKVETQPPPTPTPEPATVPACAGIFKQALYFYPIPSNAMSGEWLSEGAYVDIIGQLNEPVWYQVKFINRTGWVLQSSVRLENENCKVQQINLAEAIGLRGAPVLEDTFRDSHNWVLLKTPDQRPDRLPNSVNNYTLNVDGYFERVSLSAPALENISTFELATAYWRQNGGESSSYVGMQYGNDSQYFEVRVLGNCEIDIMTSDGFYEKQTIRNERNKCKDDISDFLFVRWDGSGLLEVGQNDIEQPFRFNIKTSMPAAGKIQLIAEEARVQFDFIAVTEN